MTFMREKLRQFMIGRYGTDGLNQFLSIASIVMLLISSALSIGAVLYWQRTQDKGELS